MNWSSLLEEEKYILENNTFPMLFANALPLLKEDNLWLKVKPSWHSNPALHFWCSCIKSTWIFKRSDLFWFSQVGADCEGRQKAIMAMPLFSIFIAHRHALTFRAYLLIFMINGYVFLSGNFWISYSMNGCNCRSFFQLALCVSEGWYEPNSIWYVEYLNNYKVKYKTKF